MFKNFDIFECPFIDKSEKITQIEDMVTPSNHFFVEISVIGLSYLFLRSAMIETLVELKEGPEETTEIPF